MMISEAMAKVIGASRNVPILIVEVQTSVNTYLLTVLLTKQFVGGPTQSEIPKTLCMIIQP